MEKRKIVNLSPDKLIEMSSTLAKVDERTATILQRLDKHEGNFADKLDNIEDRVTKLESGWGKIVAVAGAAAFVVSALWGIAGDDVKDSFRSKPAHAQTIKSSIR